MLSVKDLHFVAISMILIQVLWVHNDSGGSTWINAISEQGEIL